MVIRNRAEDLSNNNLHYLLATLSSIMFSRETAHVVDDGKPATDDNVQNTAELGAPESERVAGTGDLAKTKLRAQRASVRRTQSSENGANNTGGNALLQRQAKLWAEDTQRHDTDMNVERPPEQEDLARVSPIGGERLENSH
jgi:hypothetical protein